MTSAGAGNAASTRRLAWADRSRAARLDGLAALATSASLGSAKCGIALLGTAIGVPLWVLFGSGAAVATLVLEEFAGRQRRADLGVPVDQNTEWVDALDASTSEPRYSCTDSTWAPEVIA
jgi:hypothetical protein